MDGFSAAITIVTFAKEVIEFGVMISESIEKVSLHLYYVGSEMVNPARPDRLTTTRLGCGLSHMRS
jgi:hypothetical protein